MSQGSYTVIPGVEGNPRVTALTEPRLRLMSEAGLRLREHLKVS